MILSRFALTFALVALPDAYSFAPIQHKPLVGGGEVVSTTTSSCLNAKGATKKKKNKKTSSSGGGFGKVVERPTSKKRNDEDDDYAAFPALDAKVKETLIPSHESFSEIAQDLPPEIYDRLTQIYGFENFNYPVGWFDGDDDAAAADANSNDEGETSKEDITFNDLFSPDQATTATVKPISDFGDLLKGSSSPSTSATTTNNDFADLIASATGGETSQESSATTTESSSSSSKEEINISAIKPFSKFRVLHVDPMVLAIDDFFTSDECDAYVDLCKNPKKRTSNNDMPMMSRSKTVGKDSLAKAQRTSTTWFHHFKSVPELVAKVSFGRSISFSFLYVLCTINRA